MRDGLRPENLIDAVVNGNAVSEVVDDIHQLATHGRLEERSPALRAFKDLEAAIRKISDATRDIKDDPVDVTSLLNVATAKLNQAMIKLRKAG